MAVVSLRIAATDSDHASDKHNINGSHSVLKLMVS